MIPGLKKVVAGAVWWFNTPGLMSHDIPDTYAEQVHIHTCRDAPAMSKVRLVITAVVLEHRPVAEVVATYGVSKSWTYALLARYREEGEAAFEPCRDALAVEFRERATHTTSGHAIGSNAGTHPGPGQDHPRQLRVGNFEQRRPYDRRPAAITTCGSV